MRISSVRKLHCDYRWVPFVLLGSICSFGCDTEKYPDDLTYPPRSDLVVTDEAISELNKDRLPQRFDRPGQLPDFLKNVDEAERQSILKTFLGDDKVIDPTASAKFPPERCKLINDELVRLFGTPAHPKVKGVDQSFRDTFKLDEETLRVGSGLYRQHCLHCHGLTGDGRGPTRGLGQPPSPRLSPRHVQVHLLRPGLRQQPQGSSR